MSRITQERIVELLRDGWELGVGRGMDTRAWLQRKLMCGGESYECYWKSFMALWDKGRIEQLQRRKNDPFWLDRYKLREPK